MTRAPLEPGEVRVWSVGTDGSGSGSGSGSDSDSGPVLDAALGVLSAHERARADRMTDPAAHRDYVRAHVLLRLALTDCVPGVSADRWQFVTDDAGRPEIVGRAAHGDLRFSLSHANGVVACAVALAADCGIDVEPIAATQPRRRVLTGDESALLEGADPDAAATLYARLWTLKEAYGKARGLGLLLPFDQLHVTLGPAPTLDDRTRPGDAGGWYVEQWLPGPGHVAALAVLGPRPRVVHATGLPA
jgi:4'-phosphopantetheinyl transferase